MIKRKATLPMAYMLVLLLTTILLLPGCGKETILGNPSGGCPDSVAPAGYTITGPTDLSAPMASGGTCYSDLVFIVTDAKGNPANAICVEIWSNAYIAQHSGSPDCTDVSVSPSSTIVARTDYYGHIPVAMLTPSTTVGSTFFVEAASGAATFIVSTAAAK